MHSKGNCPMSNVTVISSWKNISACDCHSDLRDIHLYIHWKKYPQEKNFRYFFVHIFPQFYDAITIGRNRLGLADENPDELKICQEYHQTWWELYQVTHHNLNFLCHLWPSKTSIWNSPRMANFCCQQNMNVFSSFLLCNEKHHQFDSLYLVLTGYTHLSFLIEMCSEVESNWYMTVYNFSCKIFFRYKRMITESGNHYVSAMVAFLDALVEWDCMRQIPSGST